MLNFMNDHVMDEETLSVDFNVEIKSVYKQCEDPSKVWCVIELTTENANMTLDPIPFNKIKTINFSEIYAGFFCPSKQAERSVKLRISQEVVDRLKTDDVGIIFTHTGWTRLPNGSRVYVAGDRVIGKIDGVKYTIAPELLKVHLHDGPIPTVRLLQQFFTCIKKCFWILIPLIAYAIRSLLNTPFAEAGFPLRFAVHLLGEQGLGKTTTATKFGIPFDIRAGTTKTPFGFVDAGSTPAALRMICDFMHDAPMLLDDIAKTFDLKEDRRRQSTASQLIRFVANAAGRQQVSGSHVRLVRAECGMIVTDEHKNKPLSASDITRCVILVLFEQMGSLSQNDRELTASVLSRFINHFADNYNHLTAGIKAFLDSKPVYEESPRQQQHFNELECCFCLLLDFAVAEQALTWKEADELRKLANESFNVSYTHNCKMLRDLNHASLNHPGEIIREAIEDKKLEIAKSLKKFEKNTEEYDGFRDGDLVMIRQSSVACLFSEVSHGNVSTIAAGKILRECGLVAENGEKRTAAWKRDGLPRMVKLDWKTLKKKR